MARDGRASLGLVAADAPQQVVVVERAGGVSGHAPLAHHQVVRVLVLAHGHGVVDQVANHVDEFVHLHLQELLLQLGGGDLVTEGLDLGNKLVARLVRLLERGDLLLHAVAVLAQVVDGTGQLAPLLVLGDDLIDNLNGSISATLRLANQLGVSTALSAKQVNIERHVDKL